MIAKAITSSIYCVFTTCQHGIKCLMYVISLTQCFSTFNMHTQSSGDNVIMQILILYVWDVAKEVVVFFFSLFVHFLIGGKLLYNSVLLSAVQQCESITIIYESLPSGASLCCPHPTSLGHHRAPGWTSCVSQQLPTICFAHDTAYLSTLLPQPVPPSPSPAVATSLFSTRLVSTIFLDSVCVCVCVCVSHSVMSGSLQLHGLQPTRLLCPWDYPGKNTEVGCHFLLLQIPYICINIQYFDLSDFTLDSSNSLQLTQICSILWLRNIALYKCTKTSLSIHLLMDIQVASMPWIL